MVGQNEEQALLWAIQATLIQSLNMGEEKTHIETVNCRVFHTIRFYEHIMVEDDLKEVMKQFGSLFTNFLKEDITARRC